MSRDDVDNNIIHFQNGLARNNNKSKVVAETQWKVSCNSFIHTANMTNGAVLYSPLSPSEVTPIGGTTYEKSLLHQIIANDVKYQKNSKITEKNLDSRTTVVRNAPDGTVQITYRKMVNTVPIKSNTLPFILPKPSPAEYMNCSQHCNGISYPVSSLQTMASPKQVASTYSTTTDNNGVRQEGNTSLCQIISVSGSAKNLAVNFPKMSKVSVVPSDYQNISHAERYACENVLPMNFLSATSTENLTDSCTYVSPQCISESASDPQESLKNNVTITSHSQSVYMHPTVNNTIYDGTLQQQELENSFVSSETYFDRLDNLGLDLDCLDSLPIKTLYESDVSLFNPSIYSNTTQMVTDKHSLLEDFGESTKQQCALPMQFSQHDIDIVNENACTTSMPVSSLSSPIELSSNQPEELIEIIDVSPEISPTNGGTKVILIGSWNAKNARYQCKFGKSVVDAIFIQNGVLRCYSPEHHRAGKVKLRVLRNDVIISKEADFEFVDPTMEINDTIITHDQWFSISNASLVCLLEERISSIVEIMGVEGMINTDNDFDYENTEEKLLSICKQLVEIKVDFQFDYQLEGTMTVLHFAAALGYINLIQLLLHWVETNPHKLISVEASPLRKDQFELLPIMWSASKGHFNTTCVLHQWEESSLHVVDACGCSVIDLAEECGHTSLVSYLSRILKKSGSVREMPCKFDTVACPSNCEPPTVVSQSKASDFGEGSHTLGKTLAHIQSIISEDDEAADICSDKEESLFETSPFTPRQRSVTDESRVTVSSMGQLSPGSPSQNSPFNRQTIETAEFCEFFFKSKMIEKDFAELTLTDEEQEDLYQAANVIQTAFKSYKDRRKQRDVEFSAAVLIQSYYRRYKQYAAFKKMQKGALIIQNQYRAHREKAKKKFHAASVIQTYYRRYRERKNSDAVSGYQQKNRVLQQAERKNNRFLTQSNKRFSREFSDSILFTSDYHGNDDESIPVN